MLDLRRLACALLIALGACAPAEDPQLVLWVTRFDYRTADDVRTAIRNAAEAGFDAVLWQVRGNATTFYPSEIEPWALELGGADPGFDPLALALDEARRHDLDLHAWVNVVPAWWGTEPPPKELEHVWNEHPEWSWYDRFGERQALSERFYVSLNPCLPEVRAYLCGVVDELVTNYPRLAGLHLDYIRFPNEPPASAPGQDFPRDPRTLALYREASGLAPEDDPDRWNAWRDDAVTTLVDEIAAVLDAKAPFLELSAAVGPELPRALHHHQDVATWIERGLVDRLYSMNYTTDAERFGARLDDWAARAERVPVTMGVRLDAGDRDLRTAQVEDALARFGSVACFAYSSLWDSPNEAIDSQDPATRDARTERREWFVPRLRVLTEAGRKDQ